MGQRLALGKAAVSLPSYSSDDPMYPETIGTPALKLGAPELDGAASQSGSVW